MRTATVKGRARLVEDPGRVVPVSASIAIRADNLACGGSWPAAREAEPAARSP